VLPDAISIVGAPEAGDGLVMEYFDSRGARRMYRVSLDHAVLRIWRDHPPRFDRTTCVGAAIRQRRLHLA
jgi:hypothetical protein